MKLKEALTLRKPEHVKQKKNKNGITTLEEALELRKAKKYIKRTGSPGNYKYVYKITHPGEDTKRFSEAAAKVRKEIEKQKEKKPVSSKKYMKEHAGDIKKEADELRRMSEEDFKRKKEKYDKEKKKGKGAPKFTGDWDNNVDLKKYMKENKGEVILGKYKVGDAVSIAGDPDVGISDYNGELVAKINENTIMVYDFEENDFEEVETKRISKGI